MFNVNNTIKIKREMDVKNPRVDPIVFYFLNYKKTGMEKRSSL